jgi:hypothetical protein
MSKFETIDLSELVPLEACYDYWDARPGDMVRHRKWDASLGVCVSRRWGPDDKPMQCGVLWSVQPGLQVVMQELHGVSRKLNVKWSVEPDVGSEEFMKLLHVELVK